MGSGEGALSGDSYYGDGIYRSTDGGVTWTHVSTLFTGQSVSAIVVDPTNANHLYAVDPARPRRQPPHDRPDRRAVRRVGVHRRRHAPGRCARARTTSCTARPTSSWTRSTRTSCSRRSGATGSTESTDGGATWASAMGDLPAGQLPRGRHPLLARHLATRPARRPPTLYTGFDYFDLSDTYHQAQIYKTHRRRRALGGHRDRHRASTRSSTTAARSASTTTWSSPTRPTRTSCTSWARTATTLSPPSGGIFRSTDGGATWKNLGYDLHPDFHAIAFQPNDTQHIAIGNDGGVWQSHTGGGRNDAGDPLSAADWQDLNGQVDPTTAALIHSTGLAITQFTSMATVPNVPGQYWGGTQDNGTLRKSLANSRWFDQASGDGGQVIVDQTTPNTVNPTVPGVRLRHVLRHLAVPLRPERDEHVLRQRADRRRHQPEGPRRVLRPVGAEPRQRQPDVPRHATGSTARDNAETPTRRRRAPGRRSARTSPAAAPAPRRTAPAAASSRAIGVADGGDGVYAGTDEGWIQVSPDAVTAATPTWTRVGVGTSARTARSTRSPSTGPTGASPTRHTAGSARPRPATAGPCLRDRRRRHDWKDITGNLPDVPVNTIVLDPSDAKTLYVGTDVGAVRHHQRRQHWQRLGTGMPEGRRLAAGLRREQRRARRRHARPRRVHPEQPRRARRRSSCPRPTPARRSVRAAPSTTRSRSEHRQRRRHRRHDHRPAPGQHDRRVGRLTAASSTGRPGPLARADRSRRAAASR